MRFRHHDGICNPCRVPDFADDLGYLQLPHLRDDEVLLVLHLTSDFLLYRVSSQEHYKRVLNHLPWYPEKTGWVPGERVRAVPKEGDERAFLYIIEACPNGNGAASTFKEWYLLGKIAIFEEALLRRGGRVTCPSGCVAPRADNRSGGICN
jgi:hypothetical protein